MREEENFETWSFCPTPWSMVRLIWLHSYHVGCAATLLFYLPHGMVETFFMTIDMSMRTHYKLADPHLALLWKVLGNFSIDYENVKRTYEPRSVVIGVLRVYFPQFYRSYHPVTGVLPTFIPCMASLSKVHCLAPFKFYYVLRPNFHLSLPFHWRLGWWKGLFVSLAFSFIDVDYR